MLALAGTVFVASLLGSAHCAGMCGAFVCFYAGADARASAWGHLAYNGGRLVSYLLLGALAGALGAGIEQVGAGVGVARAAAVVAGVLMIAWGVVTLLVLRGVRVPLPTPMQRAQQWMAARLRAARGLSPVLRALTVGLLTTLLPCGWLYAFVVTAAGMGSVQGAMLLMAIFWAGTLPIMLAFGVGVRRIAAPLRDRLPVISAVAIVLVGVMSLSGRARMDPAKVAMHARRMTPASLRPADSTPAPLHEAMPGMKMPDAGHAPAATSQPPR